MWALMIYSTISSFVGAGASLIELCVMFVTRHERFPLASHSVLNGLIQGPVHWLCLTGAATWKDYNGCMNPLQSLHYIVCYLSLEEVKHQKTVLLCVFQKDLADLSENETVIHPGFPLVYNDNVTFLGHYLKRVCCFSL